MNPEFLAYEESLARARNRVGTGRASSRDWKRFPVLRLGDGRACINLGSSARVASGWNNLDSSWLFRAARHPHLTSLLARLGLISAERRDRVRKLGRGSVFWNLERGVPFPDETFDVVYHSHLLEHVDREAAAWLLRECRRVLKLGGILRVVVPDLEMLIRSYVGVVGRMPGEQVAREHEEVVFEILDQMVPKVPRDRAGRPAVIRILENVLVGDTAGSGALHRWMYDRFSLRRLFDEVGFSDVTDLNCATSQIEGWNSFGLDLEPDGLPYKPGSLYMEGRRT